jgi:hypothetical protein
MISASAAKRVPRVASVAVNAMSGAITVAQITASDRKGNIGHMTDSR